MRDKQGRVIILGPVSSASAPSSVRPGVPSPGSRAVITSSPHPRQASRRAGRTRQPRGVGGGGFSFKQWGATGRCDIAIRMAFLLSRTAAIIPGAGVVPHHPSRRSPRPCLIPSSSPISKRKPSKQAGRRRRGGLDDRIPAGVGKREQASKTRTTNDQLHPHHHTSHGPISYHNQSIAPPPTSTQRDDKRDAGTRNDDGWRTRRTRRRRDERWNENARATQDDKQATRRDAEQDARRDDDDKGKSKQYEAVIGGREEQTILFSHLSPDPLSPILSHPSASIIPPPPGVGRAALVGSPRSPSHPLPRRVITHAPLHPLSLAAYPHPRCHLSARAVLGSSSIHAAIAQPSRIPGKRPPPSIIMASIQRLAPRQAERGEKRNERMACGSRSLSRSLSQSSFLVGSSLRVVARRVRRRPVAYRPARFHPGGDGNSRGHVFRAVFLSSSRPLSAHRLIRPTARRSIRTSGRANSRRQGKAVGQAGERLSLSAPSRLIVSSASPPSYRVAGPYHRPTRRASKQGGLVPVGRLGPVPLLVSAPWLALGSAVNGRNGKNKTPRSPLSRNGAKGVQTLYRTRLL